jgi:hypothetical protein
MTRVIAIALVSSGCWLALPPAYDPPVRFGGSDGHGEACVRRVRSGKSSHYEVNGERIGSFALEKLVQPDARGRAGFRMQRAGSALTLMAFALHMTALTTLAAGAFTSERGGIPRWSGIATLTLHFTMVASLASGIPLMQEGGERERESVKAYNERNSCSP